MTKLEQAEQLLSDMTHDELLALYLRVAQDLGSAFLGIETSRDICGGEARVARTRIPVWVLEQARRLGADQSELLEAYPTLRPSDIAFAWAYARIHPQEMDSAISENEAA